MTCRRYWAPIRTLTGVALVAAGLVLNDWFCEAYLFDLPLFAFCEPTRIVLRARLLHEVEALCVAVGLVLVFWNKVVDWAGRFAQSRLGRLLLVPPNYRCLLAVVPLLLGEIVYWIVACRCDDVPFWSPLAVISCINGLAETALLFLLVSVALAKMLQFRYWPLCSGLLWATAIGADTLLFWFGNTRFEAQYWGMATEESLAGFINLDTVLYVVMILGLGLASGLLLLRPVTAMTWASCVRIGALLLLVWAINIPFRFFAVNEMLIDASVPSAPGEYYRHYWRLTYIAQDSVLHACVDLVAPERLSRITSLREFQSTIGHYNLPLGRQHYQPRVARPFRRVVIVFCESLSSFFLKSCNPQLPGTATPFLDSPQIAASFFRNHRTSAQPTKPALAVTFCSLPNPRVVVFARFPQAFIGVMRDHGWRTAFFSSASKYFANKERDCTDAGVQHFFGSEALSEDPHDAKYRLNWGICDRILYQRAGDYLAKHRDEPTFVIVEGADTHVPDGRTDYGDLKYPPTPEWIDREPMSGFLQSVFRMDYDLSVFVGRLKAEKLLDEDTLVILTADHCFLASPILNSLPGTSSSPFERIPLVVLSGRKLPPADRNRPTSQLDIAPSLLHLLGLPIPQGYWGRTIFDPQPAPFVGIAQNSVLIEDQPHGLSESFNLFAPETAFQRDLSLLLRSYLAPDEKTLAHRPRPPKRRGS